MLFARDSPHRQRHSQTEGERMGRNIICKWYIQTSKVNYSHITQSGFQAKINHKKQKNNFVLIDGIIQN